MAVIGIFYQKCEKIKYDHVFLHTINGEIKFDSGNFLKDWYSGIKMFLYGDLKYDKDLYYSSTVDFFINDCADFDKVYLLLKDDTGILIPIPQHECVRMFVPKGQSLSWTELKEISQ